MIKAIETHYNGYWFRSRLEARWAVFFDRAGIEYQYEPEGFQVGKISYLPDFFLPLLDLWVEIKGPFPTKQEQDKAIALTGSDNRKLLAIFHGDPHPDSHLLWFAGKCLPHFMFCKCDRCGTIGFASFLAAAKKPTLFYRLRCEHKDEWFRETQQQGFISFDESFVDCYAAARSARFEFGETPTPRGKPNKKTKGSR